MNDGKMIQILYNYWLEDHIDTDSIKDIWKKVACKLPPKDTEALNIYAEALEQQAFHFGFAAGVAMMIECVSLRKNLFRLSGETATSDQRKSPQLYTGSGWSPAWI